MPGADSPHPKSSSVFSLLLVFLQTCFSAAILLSHGLHWPRPVGFVLAVFGLLLGLWAIVAMKPAHVRILPDVSAESSLVVCGPYRCIRHPMYTGLLMVCLEVVVSRPTVLLGVLWVGLVTTLLVKAGYEERLLAKSFPEYAAYQSRTWRFLPLIL